MIGTVACPATDGLDEGPTVAQAVAKTSHRDEGDDLVRRVWTRSGRSGTGQAHLEDRVLVFDNRTAVFS